MLRLSSSSTTRAMLLKNASIDFIQESVEFDEETIKEKNPKSFVYKATIGKYEANFSHFGIEEMPLLVADTVVSCKGKILRKAKSKQEAKEMLLLQSGNITSIITCMIYHSKNLKLIDISYTDYIFKEFDINDMQKYLDSKKYIGKAGGCMVEGFCKPYIKEVKGLESVAMGLNVELLKKFYEK
jgi:septum formation protein